MGVKCIRGQTLYQVALFTHVAQNRTGGVWVHAGGFIYDNEWMFLHWYQ